jgi:hypothetical protein
VGVRKAEVYMGIDAWGRNTYGGGRYDCKVALDAISPAGLSAALFAPGWTWEHELNFQSRGAPSDDLVQAQATFFAVQREFEQIQERVSYPATSYRRLCSVAYCSFGAQLLRLAMTGARMLTL